MKFFSSKILLFGEYAIIKDGNGIAVPFDKYHASLEINPDKAIDCFDPLLSYLKDSPLLAGDLDLEKLSADIERGLYFNSNIPQGYGVGSSGALCASIYAQYSYSFERKDTYSSLELKKLQDLMALMESYYHGTSSGLDCLISLVNRPVLIEGRRSISLLEEFPPMKKFYLFDSKIQRKTSPFVHKFLSQLAESEAYQKQFKYFTELNRKTIAAYLTNADITAYFSELSHLQLEIFTEMIPADIKEFWSRGLDSGTYYTKLCGAGGGGYFLVYSDKNLTLPNLTPL